MVTTRHSVVGWTVVRRHYRTGDHLVAASAQDEKIGADKGPATGDSGALSRPMDRGGQHAGHDHGHERRDALALHAEAAATSVRARLRGSATRRRMGVLRIGSRQTGWVAMGPAGCTLVDAGLLLGHRVPRIIAVSSPAPAGCRRRREQVQHIGRAASGTRSPQHTGAPRHLDRTESTAQDPPHSPTTPSRPRVRTAPAPPTPSRPTPAPSHRSHHTGPIAQAPAMPDIRTGTRHHRSRSGSPPRFPGTPPNPDFRGVPTAGRATDC